MRGNARFCHVCGFRRVSFIAQLFMALLLLSIPFGLTAAICLGGLITR